MNGIVWSKHIPDVITKVIMGVRKKTTYYISYNSLYASPHHTIRTTIMGKLKDFLSCYINTMPKFDAPICVEIVYHSSKSTFDIDNKGAIWVKALLDLMVGREKIADDNVKYVKSVQYTYQKTASKSDSITINITMNEQ